MEFRVDRRTIEAEPDEEAIEALRGMREGWLEQTLSLARLLQRIDRKHAYRLHSAVSVQELAGRMGYDRERARLHMLLGWALGGDPRIEKALRENTMSFSSAYVVGEVFRRPELKKEGEDWFEMADQTRVSDLRRLVRRRKEEIRQGDPLIRTHSAEVTAAAKEKLDRCQEVASQRAKEMLTQGQTLDVVATSYLLLADPLYSAEGIRRMEDTARNLSGRGVPEATTRAVLCRSGGLCEVGQCDRPAVELCHIRPHRDGSPREKEDLFGGCYGHHTTFDLGWLVHAGWSATQLPRFAVSATGEILEPKPRPWPLVPGEGPAWLRRALPRGGRRVLRRLAKVLEAVGGPAPPADGGRSPPPSDEGGGGAGLVADRGSGFGKGSPPRCPPPRRGPPRSRTSVREHLP